MRRAVDVIVGGPIALVAVPVIAVLAVIGALVFSANPFFVQERVGLHGRPFRLLKLRSLPPDTPAYADKYALDEVPIPRWGRLIREFHLDELPQLLLVPIGRMSLVGPRPEMAFLHEQMPPPFAERRVAVRPGCTGLWQTSEACQRLILETPEYDDFYLTHRSWRIDVWVLWLTARKMLNLGRAVTLEQVPDWVVPGEQRAVWQPTVDTG